MLSKCTVLCRMLDTSTESRLYSRLSVDASHLIQGLCILTATRVTNFCIRGDRQGALVEPIVSVLSDRFEPMREVCRKLGPTLNILRTSVYGHQACRLLFLRHGFSRIILFKRDTLPSFHRYRHLKRVPLRSLTNSIRIIIISSSFVSFNGPRDDQLNRNLSVR
jgi:hypothetical protein